MGNNTTPPAPAPIVYDTKPKPFWKRTEFWLTALASGAATLVPVTQAGPLTIGTAAPALIPWALKLLGISLPIFGYTVSRGIAKTGTGN